MFEQLSFSCMALYGLCLVILYQVYRFVIRPKMQLKFYQDQGLQVLFSPISGYLSQASKDLAAHKDFLYTWKQLNYQNPKPRAFASNFGPYPLVALKDPELIKQFYALQEKYYVKAPPAVDVPKMILRNGTLLSEGNIWKQHRKLSAPLYSYDTLRDMVPEIVRTVDERLEKLKEKDMTKVNFMTEVQHVLTEVVGKVFLGLELSKLEFKGQTVSAFVAELIDRAGLESLELMTLLFTTKAVKMGLHPRQKNLVKDIEDLRTFLFGAAKAKLGEILAAKESGSTPGKPLLLQLIYEQMQKMNDSEITAVDLVDEFANFAMGSMDTTAHAILFSSYYILQNSAVHKKLAEEVEKTFSHHSKVTLDTLNQMDYMSATLKETLRFAAPLPNLLPRVALEDHQLGDLKIKAGTVIVLAAVCNSFDPDYHDEPESFVPERWIDENSRTKKSISNNSYVYIPFSAGARTCSGQQLGINLVKIVLGLFLKKFEYAHADKNYEMIYGSKLYIEPQHALVYTLEPKAH